MPTRREYDSQEAQIVEVLRQNRCGDPVCEESRFKAALSVLTGWRRGAHNGNAIALARLSGLHPRPEATPPEAPDA